MLFSLPRASALAAGIITAEAEARLRALACLKQGEKKGSAEGLRVRRHEEDRTKTTDDNDGDDGDDDEVGFVVADVNYRYYHHYRRTFA